MYYPRWKNYFFESKKAPFSGKWNLIRGVGQSVLSYKAQLRLEWVIFYQTAGGKNAKQTAIHFGISRKTLHKWLGRFNERNPRTLEEVSRRPQRLRSWLVTTQEETNITKLRKKNMELGKKKLQVLYQKEYGEYLSTWKIERVVRKYKLYPDLVGHKKRIEKKRRSQAKPKVRVHEIKDTLKNIKQFGFLWHIDAIIIWWYGVRRVIFTAIEEATKIAFARVYPSNTSGYAADFLKRLMYLAEGKVNIMHQDNGSEFQGAFEKACQTLGILQIYSRPRTPKDNPALEKFNDTLQREWLVLSEVGLDDIGEANQDLALWLVKYNSYRPHQALDYKTPLEYAQENFFKVLPMWSARTQT